MKRYFDEDSSHYLVLVDEAHNLVDRSKDMYSASLDLSSLLRAKEGQRKINRRRIKTDLARIQLIFDKYDSLCEYGETRIEDLEEGEYKVLEKFITTYQEVNKERSKKHS